MTALNSNTSPIGSITAYVGPYADDPNNNWLLCDGREVPKASYPDLYTALQDSFGTPSGPMVFRLPDLRGLFLRGVNGNRSDSYSDPDAGSRTAPLPGGHVSNAVGSMQPDAFASHSHQSAVDIGPNHYTLGNGNSGYSGGGGADPFGYGGTPFNTSNVGGSTETRPKNASVYWIIRVK